MILTTGAKGMLGNAVGMALGHKALLTDILELDVRDMSQVMSYVDRDIDFILHMAAETNLFSAEFDPPSAYMVNHTGTSNVVELARRLDVPLMYISTAGVFDGDKEQYAEEDSPHPLHHYGRSKYYGEVAVQTHKKHYILRGGWAMGGGPKLDKKFVNKVYKQIRSGAKKLYGVNDVFGNPTYTADLAQTISNVINARPEYGIYHASGKNVASRYEVLEELVRLLELPIEAVSVSKQEYYEMFPEQRLPTRSESLCVDKLSKSGLSAMRNWQDALAIYVEEYK